MGVLVGPKCTQNTKYGPPLPRQINACDIEVPTLATRPGNEARCGARQTQSPSPCIERRTHTRYQALILCLHVLSDVWRRNAYQPLCVAHRHMLCQCHVQVGLRGPGHAAYV